MLLVLWRDSQLKPPRRQQPAPVLVAVTRALMTCWQTSWETWMSSSQQGPGPLPRRAQQPSPRQQAPAAAAACLRAPGLLLRLLLSAAV
jgi:hypothetical protein